MGKLCEPESRSVMRGVLLAREWWRGGELHRDAEPADGPRGEDEGSVVCLGDAFDYGQAKADTCVVGAYPFGAALERFGECRDQLWRELLAGVFDSEHDGLGADGGVDPHGALFTQIVDDGVVQQVRGHLQQERVRADGGGDVARGLDADALLFGEGEE